MLRRIGHFVMAAMLVTFAMSNPSNGAPIGVLASGEFDHLAGNDVLGVDEGTFNVSFFIDSEATPTSLGPVIATYTGLSGILTLSGTTHDGITTQDFTYRVESDIVRISWFISGLFYELNLELGGKMIPFPFAPPLFEPIEVTGVRPWGAGPLGTQNEYTLSNVEASARVVPEPSSLSFVAMTAVSLIALVLRCHKKSFLVGGIRATQSFRRKL